MEPRPRREDAPLRAVLRAGELLCPLEEAALVLARQEYPELEVAPWLARLDAMADLGRPLLSATPDAAEIVGVLNDVLFRDLRFDGNRDDYYDPRNSFLNDVLERRRGIPITLGVLCIAVARRLGLELRGTAFPGHFLVVFPRDGWPIVLDPFDQGRVLAPEDCQALLQRAGVPDWNPRFLDPVGDRAILRRMLENLKSIYARRQDWERLLRTADQILALTPEDYTEHYTQSIALAGLEAWTDSRDALERYVRLVPEAGNDAAVHDLLEELRRRSA